MLPKNAESYSLLTYLWVVMLSASGGLCHHILNLRRNIITFSLTNLFGDLFISGFAGLMTFYLCEASAIAGPMQALLVGVSGHMGSRTIFILEGHINRWLVARYSNPTETKSNAQD